jgi:hypothetical protein
MVAEVVFVNSWSFNPMNKIKKVISFSKYLIKLSGAGAGAMVGVAIPDLCLSGAGAGIFRLHNTAGRVCFLAHPIPLSPLS